MTGEFATHLLPGAELAAGAGNVAESALEVSEVERLIAANDLDEPAFLDRLLKLRQQWVVANKQNKFDEGIKAVLTKVYPDKAHFIYELLQNAQDARATWVRFDLQPDCLVVTHNGKKLFDRRDVVGITSIGGSIKEDDVNQIGKFGIGFKAVFAYTASPRVFSQDYQFEIRDLVCPYPLALQHKGWNESETRFEFPFNHAKKSADQAFHETATGLRSLPDNVLLFLNHIDTIEWRINNHDTEGISRLVYDDDKHVEIERSSPQGDTRINSHWLRFRPNEPAKITVTIDDEPKDVIADVAIAFALHFKDNEQRLFDQKRPMADQMKIVPIDGQLSIFFPADKEQTNLKFHLHGPYASTVARDSIPTDDSPDNKLLLAETARLLTETLPHIRDMGLLTSEFLGVLPNFRDHLLTFYRPLRDAVVERMREQPLVPTLAGGHAPAQNLYEGLVTIRSVIGNEELPFFIHGHSQTVANTASHPQWVAGVMQNSRQDDFVHTLQIKPWNWAPLLDALMLQTGPQASDPSYAEQWFPQRSTDWMQRLYALLNEMPRQGSAPPFARLGQCKIIRLASGKHVAASEAYFPKEADASNLNLPVVDPQVLEGKNKERVAEARTFLEKVGVKEIGERENIWAILKTYYRSGNPVTGLVQERRVQPTVDEHRAHIVRFANWWAREHDKSPFKGYSLFLADAQEHSTYMAPNDLYLDKPIKSTGLAALFTVERAQLPVRHALWAGYKKLEDKEQFAEFASALGVLSELTIQLQSVRSHRDRSYLLPDANGQWSTNRIDQDYAIPHLATYLHGHSREISKLVWDTMRAASSVVLSAEFRLNKARESRKRPSTLIYELREHAWIPDTQGQFHKPTDMIRDMLPRDFPYDDENGWLSAIEFGEEARKQSEEAQRQMQEAATQQSMRQHYATQLGIPLAMADELAALAEDQRVPTLEKIGRLIKNAARTPFPERTSANPDRRAKKVTKEAQEAEDKLYEPILTSVRTSDRETTVEARTELRDLYTNDAGAMVCQMCKQEMPFKLANGSYYFEAVACVKDTQKEYSQNYLALCPICAAKYRYANDSGDGIRRLILDTEGLEIPAILAGEEESIRFTQVHLDDLRLALMCDADELEPVGA